MMNNRTWHNLQWPYSYPDTEYSKQEEFDAFVRYVRDEHNMFITHPCWADNLPGNGHCVCHDLNVPEKCEKHLRNLDAL